MDTALEAIKIDDETDEFDEQCYSATKLLWKSKQKLLGIEMKIDHQLDFIESLVGSVFDGVPKELERHELSPEQSEDEKEDESGEEDKDEKEDESGDESGDKSEGESDGQVDGMSLSM